MTPTPLPFLAIPTFPTENLLFLLVMIIPSGVLLWRWLGELYTLGLPLLRMILQLLILGYALRLLFQTDHPIALTVLIVMVGFAGWIALRPIAHLRKRLLPISILSIALGAGTATLLVTQLILAIKPWYQLPVLIPLAGMGFSQAMNGLSLFAERLYRELQTPNTSLNQARNQALRTALIPLTNQYLAVGLVSIPGVFTGQVLAGTPPLLAAQYQIVIMILALASILWSCTLFFLLSAPHFPNPTNAHEPRQAPPQDVSSHSPC